MTTNSRKVRILVQLKLEQVKIDGGTQARVKIDSAKVSKYAEILDSLPEIITFFDGSNDWLGDGFYRYHAHRHKKRGSITCERRIGTIRDAILFAVGANAEHGVPRTEDDERHAIRMLLNDAEWSKWSNQEIARQCKVDPHLVADEKRILKEKEKERKERERQAKERAEEKGRQEQVAKEQAERDKVKDGWIRPGATKKAEENQPSGDSPDEEAHLCEQTEIAAEEEQVTCRRGSSTYKMKTAKIGKRDRNAIRVEQNKGKQAILDNKIERSEKKYVLQCLQRGLLEEEIVQRVRKRIAAMMPSVVRA